MRRVGDSLERRRLESLDGDPLERRGQQPLNVAEQSRISRRHERHCAARAPGAAGAADAVHVVFGDQRQVVVDDERQLRDIETACRDIRRDQDVHATGFEVAERASARVLALVAVNDRDSNAGAFEVRADAIRASLGLAEDERLTRRFPRQDMQEHRGLLLDRDGMNMVRHGRRNDLSVRYVDARRRAGEFSRETDDRIRQRRGEQQRLARARERREHAPQRGLKAQVQHPVRFIQRDDFDGGEIDAAPMHVIKQPSGRRDDDVRALFQRLRLRAHADAAEDRRDAELHGCAVRGERAVDLGGQFARGHEDQPSRTSRPWARVQHDETLDHRQAECRGFPRARLRAREEIASRQNGRNRLGLDRCGLAVAKTREREAERPREPEIRECH